MMSCSNRIFLVDTDQRRRAEACHNLARYGLHIEPFEDVSEIKLAWSMSGVFFVEDRKDNIEAMIKLMQDEGIWLPIVGFSERLETGRIVNAVRAGAADYLDWPASAEAIQASVESANSNAAMIGNLKLREAKARSLVEKLTRREREVLGGVADGLSSKRIGERLGISPRTVEIHRANMLNKVGANHSSVAIRVAIEASLF